MYPTINLIEKKLIPMIMLYIDKSISIKADEAAKYLTFSLSAVTIITDPKTTGSNDGIASYKEYQAVPCGQLLDKDPRLNASMYLNGNKLGYLESMFHDYMLCFDFGNDSAISVEGRGSDIIYKYVTMKVKPCSLGIECKDPAVVLDRIFIGLIINQQSIALSNF